MDSKHCLGCREDFYNGKNPYGVKECWLLSGAKLITRYRIGMWDPMEYRRNFEKVTKPQCYTQKGYAFVPKIPSTAS